MKTTAAIAERCIALRTVGGLLKRSMRALRAAALRSAGPGLRPVRPRVSTIPAALPRCLVRRLRLVGATSDTELSRSSMLARLRIGTRSGQPSKAACGARPTSSASATGAWRSTASSSARQRRAPRGPRRCTRPARRRRARRASGRSRAGPAAPPRRPRGWRARSRRASSPVAGGAELEVEGHERRARGDEHRARGRVHARAGRSRARRPSAIRCARPAAPPRRSSARVRPPASMP